MQPQRRRWRRRPMAGRMPVRGAVGRATDPASRLRQNVPLGARPAIVTEAQALASTVSPMVHHGRGYGAEVSVNRCCLGLCSNDSTRSGSWPRSNGKSVLETRGATLTIERQVLPPRVQRQRMAAAQRARGRRRTAARAALARHPAQGRRPRAKEKPELVVVRRYAR